MKLRLSLTIATLAFLFTATSVAKTSINPMLQLLGADSWQTRELYEEAIFEIISEQVEREKSSTLPLMADELLTAIKDPTNFTNVDESKNEVKRRAQIILQRLKHRFRPRNFVDKDESLLTEIYLHNLLWETLQKRYQPLLISLRDMIWKDFEYEESLRLSGRRQTGLSKEEVCKIGNKLASIYKSNGLNHFECTLSYDQVEANSFLTSTYRRIGIQHFFVKHPLIASIDMTMEIVKGDLSQGIRKDKPYFYFWLRFNQINGPSQIPLQISLQDLVAAEEPKRFCRAFRLEHSFPCQANLVFTKVPWIMATYFFNDKAWKWDMFKSYPNIKMKLGKEIKSFVLSLNED